MTQDHPYYYKHSWYGYLLLALIAALLFSLPVSAQRRNSDGRNFNRHDNHDRQERNLPPGQARKQERQNDRWPGNRNNQDNNGWNNNRREQRSQSSRGGWDNRPGRQDRRQQSSPVERRQRGYGNSGNRHFDNRRPVRSYHIDHFRYDRNYRRPVYNRYNPGWRYSYLPRRNSIVASFSFPFTTITFGGYNYRYCDGVYYRPYNNAYRVCGAPVGLYVNILPFGYSRIIVNDYPYYYYNGTYYDEYEDSYRVVAPPVGAIVESIPEGYETIVIDGETYYKVDDVQYKAVINEDGEIWYEVIKVG